METKLFMHPTLDLIAQFKLDYTFKYGRSNHVIESYFFYNSITNNREYTIYIHENRIIGLRETINNNHVFYIHPNIVSKDWEYRFFKSITDLPLIKGHSYFNKYYESKIGSRDFTFNRTLVDEKLKDKWQKIQAGIKDTNMNVTSVMNWAGKPIFMEETLPQQDTLAEHSMTTR